MRKLLWFGAAMIGSALLGAPAGAESYGQFVQRLGGGGGFQPTVEQLLLAKVNAYRRANGLAALGNDGSFKAAARAHAMDMAQHGSLTHSSSTGLGFSSRMSELSGGRIAYSRMGENAAMMYPANSAAHEADVLFTSWVNSSEHRANMLNSAFSRVATGVVVVGGKAWADQIFVGAPLR